MDIEPGDAAGWYGAIVASIVLLWDIWKSLQEGPKLHISMWADLVMAGNGEISKEKFISVRIHNIGKSATTIEDLYGQARKKKFFKDEVVASFVFPNLINCTGINHVLQPGSIWKATIPQGDLFDTQVGKQIFIGVQHSFQPEKPVYKMVKRTDSKAKK